MKNLGHPSHFTWMPALQAGCGAVTTDQAYHMAPPHTHTHPPAKLVHLLSRGIKCPSGSQGLGPHFTGQHVHLFSDNNATAVAIFPAGKGKDAFIQACDRDIWLTCAAWDITLAVGHVSGHGPPYRTLLMPSVAGTWASHIRRECTGCWPLITSSAFQSLTNCFICHMIFNPCHYCHLRVLLFGCNCHI